MADDVVAAYVGTKQVGRIVTTKNLVKLSTTRVVRFKRGRVCFLLEQTTAVDNLQLYLAHQHNDL